MFKSFLNFISSIFNFFRDRKISKEIEAKHKAQLEIKRLEENKETERLKIERKEEISIIEEKVKDTKKPKKKNRTTRVIKG